MRLSTGTRGRAINGEGVLSLISLCCVLAIDILPAGRIAFRVYYATLKPQKNRRHYEQSKMLSVLSVLMQEQQHRNRSR
jgi:hypothetical protein